MRHYPKPDINRNSVSGKYARQGFADYQFQKPIEESLSAQMEKLWHTYFEQPKDARNGIEWEGKVFRPAVFDDMYLAQCKDDNRTPDEKILGHFQKCVNQIGYEPKYYIGTGNKGVRNEK